MRPAYGHASRAVLIGSSTGDDSRDAAVERQLRTLADQLTEGMRWGLPANNCILLPRAQGPDEVRLALKNAGDGVGSEGLLLVHYVGAVRFGRVDPLSLVLPGGTFDYAELRWRVRENSARYRVVVLDCYSDVGGSTVALATAGSIDRTSLLVRSTPVPDEPYPQLTEQLADLLTVGLPRGPNLLDLHRVFQSLVERLGPANPPALRPDAAAESVPLIYNPALFRRNRVGQVFYATDAAAETDLAEAVVLIMRYDKEEGALGIILNRPAGPAPSGLGTLTSPAVVFEGGPVPHEGYILLARLRDQSDAPLRFRPITDELGTLPLSASPSGGALDGLRLFQGYLGWGPGELEADLAGELLVPTDASADVAFTDVPGRLRETLQVQGS
jgi:putative transcriptional regulator